MNRKILLTGGTGTIGSGLAPRLATNDTVTLRMFVRSPEKVTDLQARDVEVVQGSFEDAASLRAALDGIDTIVLITPFSPDAFNQAHDAIAAAQEAQVRRIVRLSVIKADPTGPSDSYRQHGRTDEEILQTGLTYTILRPNLFMKNLFSKSALESMLKSNIMTTTMGNSRTGMIDERDIVDVFERVVVSDDYDNQIFTLTGPASISLTEAAGVASKILGCEINYVPIPEDESEQWWRNMGLSGWYLDTLCEYDVAFRQNHQDVVTDSVKTITGHRARSLEDYIKEVSVLM
jgi:uncharacterized protein YbjT (DUF2867 family)